MSRGRVLIVDDDPIVIQITRARLEAAGFEVVWRDRALGTTQAIRDESPDVVLLDLKMPALSGDMIADLLAKQGKGLAVPIIFHSSESLMVLQEKARKAGVVGAIPKTEDDKMFLAQFERLFDRAMRGHNMP